MTVVGIRSAPRRRTLHAIADISFSGGWVRCQCGAEVRAIDDDELAEGYQRHRTSVGVPRRQLSGMENRNIAWWAA